MHFHTARSLCVIYALFLFIRMGASDFLPEMAYNLSGNSAPSTTWVTYRHMRMAITP